MAPGSGPARAMRFPAPLPRLQMHGGLLRADGVLGAAGHAAGHVRPKAGHLPNLSGLPRAAAPHAGASAQGVRRGRGVRVRGRRRGWA
eukprot:3002924-Pyramimonas_sp.AAC.1